jgi:hypothetical protein
MGIERMFVYPGGKVKELVLTFLAPRLSRYFQEAGEGPLRAF